MITEPGLVTAAEFSKLPEGWTPTELIDGVIVFPEQLTFGHQQVVLRLAREMTKFEREQNIGEWMGLRLDLFISPYNVFQPDSTFWKRGQIPHPTRLPVIEIPGIVIEVLSASSRPQDLGRKRVGYADRGIAEYWTLDPDSKRMLISLRDESGVYIDHDVTGSAIPVGILTGTNLDLDWIFEE